MSTSFGRCILYVRVLASGAWRASGVDRVWWTLILSIDVFRLVVCFSKTIIVRIIRRLSAYIRNLPPPLPRAARTRPGFRAAGGAELPRRRRAPSPGPLPDELDGAECPAAPA